MMLKRHFVPGSVDAQAPKVAHVEVMRHTHDWYVPPDLLTKGVSEGWLSMADGKVTLKTADGLDDIVYQIVHGPGWYCSHCGKELSDSREGAAHVAEQHAGVKSPDQNNPSGWSRDNHYTLKWVSGGTPKPPQTAKQFRYALQQEQRRHDAEKKIKANAAKLAAQNTSAPAQ